jgi:putative thioredoxin
MMSANIIDATEADFEYQVLVYSQEIPVLVDFWAEWCAPCRVLGPMLEKLTKEAQGDFRLAKVNVDENPNLAKRYQVRSIPAVKAFREGKVVAEFLGVRPESQIKELIRSFAPTPGDLAIEKGLNLLELGQPTQAEVAFRQSLAESPGNPKALLGLARSLIYQNQADESLEIIQNFPVSRELNSAEALLPLAEALADYSRNGLDDNRPLDATYANAIRLIQRGNFEAALDGLLDILRQEKRFRDGLARKVILAIFEVLGDNSPVTTEYRRELANILF